MHRTRRLRYAGLTLRRRWRRSATTRQTSAQKALIAVAYSTLARRAELIDLRIEDITFGAEGDGTVTLRTKGRDQKERYLALEAGRAIEAWLDFARINLRRR